MADTPPGPVAYHMQNAVSKMQGVCYRELTAKGALYATAEQIDSIS
jgi:hypothetical protein